MALILSPVAGVVLPSGVLESADVERDRVVLSVAWWHGLSLGSVVGWLVGSLVGLG